jgi:RNA-directed DNA polymerase
VNQVLASLGLAKHPDKTFIGRIAKGFDWLGYHISRAGLRVATKTLQNFVTRSLRLYEQEWREGGTSSRLGDYVRWWVRWVHSAVCDAPGVGATGVLLQGYPLALISGASYGESGSRS